MNSEHIYIDLLNQYNNLSDKEKNSIMIYKSSLFYHINSISKVNDYENKSAEEIFMLLADNNTFVNKFVNFKQVLTYPQNMLVRYSYFNDINFDDILSFIDDMKKVCQILKEARSKIKLCDDLKVYRGISVKNDTCVNSVSNSEFISTSIKIDDANDFIYQNGMDKSHLFIINLKKGTNVLVTPLSLVREYKDGISMLSDDAKNATLKVINRGLDGQTEIILFRDNLEFIEVDVCELEIDEDSPLIMHNLIAKPKLEEKKQITK